MVGVRFEVFVYWDFYFAQ
jgi:hypothetical protein